MPSAAGLPHPLWRIGRYSILERIGRGGMGMVYRALDASLEREVAIKILTAEGLRDTAARQRFEIEAKAAAQLQHPNIVTIYELGEERGVPFIAMELLGGTDLETLVRSGETLLTEEKISVVLQICRGLAYAHHRHIVHRDIKPSNIRILDDGTVKIVDFGIAKLGGVNLTQSGMVVGTVHYMSPEQIRGQPLDGRSDLFSLGVILFELLQGARPFEGSTTTDVLYKIIHAPLPAMQLQDSPEADRLRHVVERALARPLGDRYPDAEAMARDLAGVAGEHASEEAEAARATPGVAEARRLLSVGSLDETIGRLTEILATHPHALDARRTLRAARRMQATPPKATETPREALTELAATFGVEPPPVDLPLSPATVQEGPARRPRPALLWIGAALVTLAIGAGVLLLWVASARPPAPVSIEVRSRPAGAKIFVDGHDTGLVTDARIAPAADVSRVQLTLRKPGFVDHVESVTLPRQAAAPLVARLTPASTRIRVTSTPAGARVSLDGVPLEGVTPLDAQVDDTRDHVMTMTLHGYRPATLEVKAGDRPPEWSVHLASAAPPGQVLVNAPYSVQVTEAGRTLAEGQSPLVLSLTPGTHQLTIISRTYFLRASRQVEVAPGEQRALGLPGVGQINVQARPDNCEVFIDGFFADYPPILGRSVASGTHRIQFKWPDGQVQEQSVEIDAGQPAFVTGRKP